MIELVMAIVFATAEYIAYMYVCMYVMQITA